MNKKNEIITLEAYLMGRDKQYPAEFTEELKNNAIKLLETVNEFLTELGIDKVSVNSGWRPAAINAQISGAAKKSNHMICKAIDIKDPDGKLDELVEKNQELLIKYDLWQEDPSSTKGWLHLDNFHRGERSNHTFKIK